MNTDLSCLEGTCHNLGDLLLLGLLAQAHNQLRSTTSNTTTHLSQKLKQHPKPLLLPNVESAGTNRLLPPRVDRPIYALRVLHDNRRDSKYLTARSRLQTFP